MKIRQVTPIALILIGFIGCGVNPGSAPSAQELIQAESDAVALLKSRGSIEEKQYPPGKGYIVDLSSVTITDEDLAALAAANRVAELDLSSSSINDEQFAKLTSGSHKLSNVFKIDVSDTAITDTALVSAQELNLLAKINVKGSKVTEKGVEELSRARKLKKLPFGLKFEIER